MVVLVNRAKMTTSTTGTGTITLGSVVDGYQTFAAAGVSNGDSVRYVIEDGTSNWEIGSGTYTASGTTLSRNPSESSDGGSAITLSGDAIVFISAIASDIQPITYVTTTFTATAAQTTFTVSYTAGLVEVFLNGAKLSGADFTATNGTSIVLASGANVGDTVDVIAYGTVSVANTYTQAQADALFVDVAGDTMTGNLSFGDNDKAIFGAGSDLQIYHDGSNSVIKDNGTGKLIIDTDGTAIEFQKAGLETLATFATDGAVQLYYDNAQKFATTATGIDVTGTVTADGLTVDSGSTNTVATFQSTDAGAGINFTDNTGSSNIQTNGAELRIGVDEDAAVASSAIKFRVDGSTKATIDSSGNVGIGLSTNIASKLHVNSELSLGPDNNNRMIVGSTSGGVGSIGTIEGGTASFSTMTFTGGNVGIGSSAPGMLLEVDASSGSANDIARFSGRNSGGLTFRNATANEFILHTATSDALIFGTNGNNERMRIDSSGNLLVGSTNNSPATNNVAGSSHGSLGNIQASVDGNPCLFVNRKSNDGDIISFRKDGSAVGSIGTAGGDLLIYSSAASHGGLRFGQGYIFPVDNTGATSNGNFDLGISGSSAFKDLYLSGKAYDGDGNLRAIPKSGSDKTSSYTLTTGDVGNFIGIGSGGSITVPNSTFSTGDAVSIFNNTSGDRTITLSISTAYIAGTDGDVNSVTLATRGVCTILFISGTVCVVSGNVS